MNVQSTENMDRDRFEANGGHAGSNLESASAHNRRVTLQAVRLYGPISRPELAGITGLTLPTVSTIAADLMDRGLVRMSGRRKGRRGQPAVELSLDPDGGLTFGVNIGADHVTTVLVDLAGEVRDRVEHAVSRPTPERAFEIIAEHTKTLAGADLWRSRRILGLGVAVPARFGAARSELIPPPYLESWRSADIPTELGKVCGLRVWVENDANAAALGESYYGAGREVSNFLYIYMGFGIGAGLVIDRELYLGARGNAGAISLIQFADQPVPPARSVRPDGGATGALYRLLRDQGMSVRGPNDLEPLFNQGNPYLMRWLDDSAELLATPIAAAQCLLDPQVILVGGRIPSALLGYLVEKLASTLPPWLESVGHQPRLLHAKSGIDAAALGAAILPFYNDIVPRREALLKRTPEVSTDRRVHI